MAMIRAIPIPNPRIQSLGSSAELNTHVDQPRTMVTGSDSMIVNTTA